MPNIAGTVAASAAGKRAERVADLAKQVREVRPPAVALDAAGVPVFERDRNMFNTPNWHRNNTGLAYPWSPYRKAFEAFGDPVPQYVLDAERDAANALAQEIQRSGGRVEFGARIPPADR